MSCPHCDQLKHGIRRALQAIFAANVRVAKDELQQVLQTGVAFDAPLDPAPMQSVITWVPVSERLPDAGLRPIVLKHTLGSYVTIGYYSASSWHLSDGTPSQRITLWAELPTPPASDEPERAPDCTCAGPAGVPHEPGCAFWTWYLKQPGAHR